MIKKTVLILVVAVYIFCPVLTRAADESSLALTITPPLMKINMEPGEGMATSIKVVNNNSYPVTIYAKVVDFKDNGFGGVKFLNNGKLPDTPENQSSYLSQWITLSQESQPLEPYKTGSFSFTIDVPENAQPGGHYAAVLIGVNPPDDGASGTEIKVSSYLSSLLLVRISGDIIEKGRIREFTFSNRFYSGGDGNFRIRFDNLGNVHLVPSGDIKIYDMFGKLKATIPFNDNSDFGNILPQSERTWDKIKWKGDDFFIINHYRADLSISYGDEVKQTEYQTYFFWGVNWRWLGIIVGSLLGLLLLIILFVRFYVRMSVKSLEKQMKAAGLARKKSVAKKDKPTKTRAKPVEEVVPTPQPEKKRVIDLRSKK